MPLARSTRAVPLGLGLLLAAGACSSGGLIRSESEPPLDGSPVSSNAGPTSTEPSTPISPLIAMDPPYFAMSVPGSELARVRATEAAIGSRIDLIRWFRRWDSPRQLGDMAILLGEGRRVHVSLRPAAGGGRIIPWRDLAEAPEGSPLYDEWIAWIDFMVALPDGSFVTMNHEPETTDSAANGDAADFIAMWQRFHGLVHERGGDHLQLVWVMTGGSFTRDTAEEWYPGDAYVDVIGADVYNWYQCQGTNRPWRSFEELLAAPIEFAQARSKPLAVPETASVEDPERPEAKAEWIRQLAETVSRDDLGVELLYVSWFNVTAPGGTWPQCVWDIDTSASSAAAFSEYAEARAVD